MIKILFKYSSISPGLNLVFSQKFTMVLLKKNRFLVPLNVIGSKIFDKLCRSLNIFETKNTINPLNTEVTKNVLLKIYNCTPFAIRLQMLLYKRPVINS